MKKAVEITKSFPYTIPCSTSNRICLANTRRKIDRTLEGQRWEKIHGYIRVSAKEQNEGRQRIAIQESDFFITRICTDKVSGKNFERPQLLRVLKPGDILVVKSIDRLGRNYKEILEQWRILTKQKEVRIVVLDTPLLDTRREK